jgi:hypothetical protein
MSLVVIKRCQLLHNIFNFQKPPSRHPLDRRWISSEESSK